MPRRAMGQVVLIQKVHDVMVHPVLCHISGKAIHVVCDVSIGKMVQQDFSCFKTPFPCCQEKRGLLLKTQRGDISTAFVITVDLGETMSTEQGAIGGTAICECGTELEYSTHKIHYNSTERIHGTGTSQHGYRRDCSVNYGRNKLPALEMGEWEGNQTRIQSAKACMGKK